MSNSNTNPGSMQKPPPSAAVSATRRGGQSQRRCLYRGVRSRGKKWVSEIRERRKPGRIWLGTYPTPEMAAAAYDAASLALAWPNAALNFPNLASTYPIPASLSALDIQVAAAAAAASRGPPPEPAAEQSLRSADVGHRYIDEEELFDMPGLLVDMAEGMLMSPPPMICDNGSVQNFEGDSLWSAF